MAIAADKLERQKAQIAALLSDHTAAVAQIRGTMPLEVVDKLVLDAHKQFAKAAQALTQRHREEDAHHSS